MESSGKVPGLEPVVSSNFQSPFNGYLRDETVIAQALVEKLLSIRAVVDICKAFLCASEFSLVNQQPFTNQYAVCRFNL